MTALTIREVQRFARDEHERLAKLYGFTNSKSMNLPVAVKIMEELGELCNEVLANFGLQRKEKLESFDQESLEEEFADVLLTTHILAHNMGINVEKGLQQKMKKIEARYQKP